MPTECIPALFGFEPAEGRRVVAAFDGGRVTTDAGALLLGKTERAINLIRRFAGCFEDRRSVAGMEHALATLVGQRVFAIALGYEDLIDHDQLRHDPVLAALTGKLRARRRDCAPLAGKSTLNRLEHAPADGPTRYHKIGHAGAPIERLFVDLFLEHGAGQDRCRSFGAAMQEFQLAQSLLQALPAAAQRLIDRLRRRHQSTLQDGKREPDRPRPLVVLKRLGPVELLPDVFGDFLVETRLPSESY